MILILGVAGSGKSTQGQLLRDTGKFAWLSMGELLRRNATPNEQQQMLTGTVLPDDVTIRYVAAELDAMSRTPEILLDGFPRTVAQAEWLVCYAEQHDPLRAIIHLKADQDMVLERLLARGRVDDTPEAIAERFIEYDKTIVPIIRDLKEHHIPVIEVNAHQSVEDIHYSIMQQLELLTTTR